MTEPSPFIDRKSAAFDNAVARCQREFGTIAENVYTIGDPDNESAWAMRWNSSSQKSLNVEPNIVQVFFDGKATGVVSKKGSYFVDNWPVSEDMFIRWCRSDLEKAPAESNERVPLFLRCSPGLRELLKKGARAKSVSLNQLCTDLLTAAVNGAEV